MPLWAGLIILYIHETDKQEKTEFNTYVHMGTHMCEKDPNTRESQEQKVKMMYTQCPELRVR